MSYAPLRSDSTDQPNDFKTPASSLSYIRSSALRVTRQKRTRRRLTRSAAKPSSYPIIAHSHLCWDWVWQRPQQFLSRLSERHPVLFVEMLAPDPSLAAPFARFRTPEAFPNLTVLTMQFPAWRWSDGAWVDAERRRLVREFQAGPGAGRFERPLQWFYDPMAVRAFAGHMDEVLTVYDCMDELSKFACAPPDLIERESELLERAEVMFTGGRKLFEAKSRFHPNCHCYGCGVEWEHFGKALALETAVPPQLASLPKPVLGYFGVIDERLDYGLLDELARAMPEASLVMIGPVMKIDIGALPQRPNLHWLGKKAYAELPAFAKGFDLCLMPFALNDATEFINPTKALEYMAAGRPIVSTPVADVVRNFSSVIQVARTRADFIDACWKAATRPDPEAVERGLELARANSWDRIVAELERHIAAALRGRTARTAAASVAASAEPAAAEATT